jgi:hypothetical protein
MGQLPLKYISMCVLIVDMIIDEKSNKKIIAETRAR